MPPDSEEKMSNNEENLTSSNHKTQITIKIDLDVLNYFKERASEPNAAPYQTQINNELRAVMENNGKEKVKNKKEKDDFDGLLSNKKFLKALAKEVKKLV